MLRNTLFIVKTIGGVFFVIKGIIGRVYFGITNKGLFQENT